MSTNATIKVTQCDNEMVLMAYDGSNGYVVANLSYTGNVTRTAEITIHAGNYVNPAYITNNSPQNVSVALPAGSYQLVAAGVNWLQSESNPWSFSYRVNNGPVQQGHGSGPKDGIVWQSNPQSFTIDKSSQSDYTKLSVTNNTDKEVEVYVTFAAANAANKCCPKPACIADFDFLTKVNDLMGKFNLGPNATQQFDPKELCFSGNVCFYIEPQCPVKGADFNGGKEGTSIAEFTLNPCTGCEETFDISCVNGVNSYIKMTVEKDAGWYYGPNDTPVTSIANKGLQQNKGNPGVYPVNCTDCIRLVGDKPCNCLPVGPAQTERICNIQRSGRGGELQITLNDSYQQ